MNILLTFYGIYTIITCMEEKNVKKDKTAAQDDLLPEYDLEKLRVRGVGPGRKYFAGKLVVQRKQRSSSNNIS